MISEFKYRDLFFFLALLVSKEISPCRLSTKVVISQQRARWTQRTSWQKSKFQSSSFFQWVVCRSNLISSFQTLKIYPHLLSQYDFCTHLSFRLVTALEKGNCTQIDLDRIFFAIFGNKK